ncbi:EamA family transporter [Embleya scabrispora]|uniref:EamA family transporter n=1 Tax=Embleya scabrispora TaxID=159449 RepID=A0A1T3P5N7_9ACTN|nr:EamA family transporter [Embleya scabrispora]OPC84271.1 EamA family transporter [Embleya scabrispora]
MSRRGALLFACMCVIWGIPYLLIKVAVDEVSPGVLVFARTGIGALLLLPFALRGGGMRGLAPYKWPLLVFAVTEFVGPWWLLSDAERRLSSSTTGLLIASVPIFGAVLVYLTGGTERMGPVRWAGLAIGFGGVAVLAGPTLGGGDPWAAVEVLATALCYAGAALVAERRLKDVPSLPMTVVCLGFTALVYTPLAAVQWPAHAPGGKALAAIGVLALVCTAIAMVIFFELVREVGAARATVITYVNPAVAVAAGVLILDETFTLAIGASFVLILGGAVLATRKNAAPADADTKGIEAAEATDDLPGAKDASTRSS